ncbi:MAG: hypothetical protein JXB13_23145 [Phycisphaerae bacterium]|nr:hypothetical protein [Phycisphaerae bacterium]
MCRSLIGAMLALALVTTASADVLTNAQMTVLEGDALADSVLSIRPKHFAGCGELQRGPQTCVVFRANSGEAFFVENTDGFLEGDRVWVSGWVNPRSRICFPFIGPAIENNTIYPCLASCGVLGHGPQSCTMFHADSGESFAIGNTGGFFVGARVYVTGPIIEGVTMCWPASVPAIRNNTIQACFEGCGVLGLGPQSCTMFHADSGESFAIRNTGDFFIGDRVYVTGPVVEESMMCWPVIGPAIEDNTIQACFKGCGVLGHGPQSCTLFHADSGESFAIGNIGDFFVGDRVYVTGPVVEESMMCWPVIRPAIEDNTIGACPRTPSVLP